MIRIGDLMLETDMVSILETLRVDLASKNIHRFAQIKELRDNMQTNCPFHKYGQERS